MPRPDETPHERRAAAPGERSGTDQPLGDRWWWTGTFRAVLGAVVVMFQWPLIREGEAMTWNWVVAGAGALIAVWGLWLVWDAWRRLDRGTEA